MPLETNVFDVWVFRRSPQRTEFPQLRTAQLEARSYLDGGRFWRIPSGFVAPGEAIVPAIDRRLTGFRLAA